MKRKLKERPRARWKDGVSVNAKILRWKQNFERLWLDPELLCH